MNLIQLQSPAAHAAGAATIVPLITAARPISVSQAKTFTICPQRWFYDTAGYSSRSQSAEAAAGSAIDDTIGAVLALRRDQHEETPAATIRDFARERARCLLPETLPDAERERIADNAALCSAAYFQPDAPGSTLQAQELQRRVRIQIPHGPLVRGVIDIETADRIIDIKTAKSRSKPARLIEDHKLQLTTYAIATGQLRVQIHCIVRTKIKAPAVITAPTAGPYTVTPKDIDFALSLYRGIQESMLSGRYNCHREHFLCTRRHCEHWQVCEGENGGSVKE